ncbi:MAG TPA: hypothetical protein VLU91_09925 [Nitrososphaerales archaeon]|nr:hypothetical protein [Nitrososphaerales archaeon]
MTARQDMLEGALFAVLVVASDVLAATDMGWALLPTPWNSIFLSVVPIFSFATLASYLGFGFLEDYLRSRGRMAAGFRP